MPSYTVKAVKQIANGGEAGKEWTRQKVRLIGPESEMTDATLFCNRFTPVPKEGDTLDGTIEPAKQEGWLPELKLPRKGGGGFQGGGPRPEDPKRMASIAMQHSQDTAWRIVQFALENNLLQPEPGKQPMQWLCETVAYRAEQVYQQVKEAQDRG